MGVSARPVLLPGPTVDYYPLYYDDDDGDDDYHYDEDELDAGLPFLDVPVVEGAVPYSYCGFRKSFLCSEPPPQLPRTSPTALDARLDRLPTPRCPRLTAEVGSPSAVPLPGAGGSQLGAPGTS